jgi:hypothetical protein
MKVAFHQLPDLLVLVVKPFAQVLVLEGSQAVYETPDGAFGKDAFPQVKFRILFQASSRFVAGSR